MENMKRKALKKNAILVMNRYQCGGDIKAEDFFVKITHPS